jgi:hypothetical protein
LDTEAEVLYALGARDAGVEGENAIAEVEGETWSSEELSDDEMSDEDKKKS